MGQIRGANVKLVGYTETTFDEAPSSPSGLLLPYVQYNVKVNQSRDTDETIDGYRGTGRSVGGNLDVSGNIQLNLAPQTCGFWFRHLFGEPTTTGSAAPYTHTFQAAASGSNALPPGLTLEEDLGADMTAASRFLQKHGCRVSQGQFTLQPSGFVKLQLDIMGASYERASAALDATPDDNGHSAFRMLAASLAWGSGGATELDVTQLQFTWNNNLDGDTYVIGGQGKRGDLPEGKAVVTGSIDTLLKDDTLLDLQMDDTDTSLVITLQAGTGAGTTGNEKLTITIPNLVFAVDSPVVPGPKGLRLTGDFTAHRTTAELAITAMLLSPLATV